LAGFLLRFATLSFPASPAGGADSDRGKENREPVTEYEILLLLDPDLSDERQGEVLTRVRELVEKGGGTFDRHDEWGRRKLAYEIDKKGDGFYHLVHVGCEPETLDEVSRVLKIDDSVMRHMATRRVGTGTDSTVAVGAPASDHADVVPASAPEEE
jgi:small subunit ribosomal protein S6